VKMLPALMALLPGLMGAAGGAMNLFGNKKRSAAPMNAANPYLNSIPGQVNPYYAPYMNAGNDALNKTKSEYDKLIGDPNAMYDKFAGGYKESPGYKSRMEEAMRAITNSQAAGGMAGSMQHQQYSADKALDLHSKDFEDYLNHVMGLYGAGLSGESGIEKQGFEANTDYANMLANITGQKASMAYGAKNQENENYSKGWDQIFGGLGSAAGGYNDFMKLLGNKGGK
jgi:hypothetical protein